MRAVATLALAALLTATALGCGGEGGSDVGVAQPAPAGAAGRPDAAPGLVVLRFVRAARRFDVAGMWSLLSVETRAGLGGTLTRFRGGAGFRYAEQFEFLVAERVVLARSLGRYAVAAVAGLRPPDEDEEPEAYAYAAALVREGGGWRLELEGVAFERPQPAPLDETADRPVVGVRADAAGRVERLFVWLDGRPFRAPLTRELVFSAELEARPAASLADGVHHVVAFAQGGGTAGAIAWPFLVE